MEDRLQYKNKRKEFFRLKALNVKKTLNIISKTDRHVHFNSKVEVMSNIDRHQLLRRLVLDRYNEELRLKLDQMIFNFSLYQSKTKIDF